MAFKRPGLLGIVLAVSLLGNFIIVGAVSGFFLGGWHLMPQAVQSQDGADRGTRRGPAPPFLRPVLQQMDRSEARDFIRSLRDAQRGGGLTRDAQQTTWQTLSVAVASDPFDGAAVSAALSEIRSDQNQRLQVTHDILVQTLAEMSVDQRAAIAADLVKQRNRSGRQRDRK